MKIFNVQAGGPGISAVNEGFLQGWFIDENLPATVDGIFQKGSIIRYQILAGTTINFNVGFGQTIATLGAYFWPTDGPDIPFAVVGPFEEGSAITGWIPGGNPVNFPETWEWLAAANEDVVFHFRYNGSTWDVISESEAVLPSAILRTRVNTWRSAGNEAFHLNALIDGNENTFWHGRWNAGSGETNPEVAFVDLDLGFTHDITRIEIDKRVHAANGNIRAVQVFSHASQSNTWPNGERTWPRQTEPNVPQQDIDADFAPTGWTAISHPHVNIEGLVTPPNNITRQTVTLTFWPALAKTRYVRLGISSFSGNNTRDHAQVSAIRVFGVPRRPIYPVGPNPIYDPEIEKIIDNVDPVTAEPTVNRVFGRIINNVEALRRGTVDVTLPNLLHNWDFRNPVNQRGQETYFAPIGVINTLDRWILQSGTVILCAQNGITLERTSATSQWTFFNQRIAFSDRLVGRTVTGSVMLGSGEVVSGTWTVPSGAFDFPPENLSSNFRFNLHRGQSGEIQFRIYTAPSNAPIGTRLEIMAVKLENGAVSTLANDLPMDFARELSICQRYQVELNQHRRTFSFFGMGVARSTTEVRIIGSVTTNMRLFNPSIAQQNNLELRLNDASSVVIPATITEARVDAGNVILTCTATNLIVGSTYSLRSNVNNAGTILLDANL